MFSSRVCGSRLGLMNFLRSHFFFWADLWLLLETEDEMLLYLVEAHCVLEIGCISTEHMESRLILGMSFIPRS